MVNRSSFAGSVFLVKGGDGKQRDNAGKCSPQSAIPIIKGPGTGVEQGEEPTARLRADQLVCHKDNAKTRSELPEGGARFRLTRFFTSMSRATRPKTP